MTLHQPYVIDNIETHLEDVLNTLLHHQPDSSLTLQQVFHSKTQPCRRDRTCTSVRLSVKHAGGGQSQGCNPVTSNKSTYTRIITHNIGFSAVMKKASRIILVLLLSLALSVSHAQEGSLLPPDLPVITPNNIDQVQEITSIGNGGAGRLYWSPDGKTLALNNSYGVWLHDIQALADEPRFIPEPDLDAVHFSDDGTLLVTWRAQRHVDVPARVWEVATGEEVLNWKAADISENPNWRYQIDAFETGPMVDRHQLITFRDIVTGKELYRYRSHPANLYFSGDRSIAAIGHGHRNHLTFDVAIGEPIWIHTDESAYVPGKIRQLSSDGNLVIMSTSEGDLSLHRSSDGEFIRQLETTEERNLWFIGFTPDDRHIVARDSTENLVLVWETQTGEILNTFQLDERFASSVHDDWTIVADDLLMAVSTGTGHITFYNLQTAEETAAIHADEVLFDYAYSTDGCCVATISVAGVLRIWDLETVQQVFQMDRYQAVGEVTAISPDGRLLVTVEPLPPTRMSLREATVRIWDLHSGQVIDELEQPYSPYPIVEFHPDGGQFATNTMGPYSLERGNWAWNMPGLSALDIAYSPDGRYFAVTGGTYGPTYGLRPPIYHTLTIYDASEQLLASIPESIPDGGGFMAVAFSADGQLIAAASDSSVTIWRFNQVLDGDYTPEAILQSLEMIGDLAFSPDGTRLIAGHALLRTGGDGFASLFGPCATTVWNVDDVLERAAMGETDIEGNDCYTFIQSFGPARYVTYSPNGETILIYGKDSSWQNSTTPMTLLDASTGEVLRHFWTESSFVMSPDGTFMISEGTDQRLHFWRILPAPD